MLSSPVLAILGNALFTCKTCSDWLVPVLQRLICEGKEVCVEKVTRRGCSPCILRRTKTKTKIEREREREREREAAFLRNATEFFFRKSVFCTWDIPIVLYVRYQNALFCAHEMSRYPAMD